MAKKQLSVNRLRDDPVYFATEFLNLKLHEGQKKILMCKSRFIAARCSRRFGKSFIFSVMAIHACYTNNNYRVILVSKSQRQSLEMFNTIYSILMGSKIASSSITRSTMSVLEFENGSKIESIPGGNPDSLRGLTIDLCLVDEASYVPDSLFTVISPTIMSRKGKIMLISTPNLSSGEFFRACQEDSIYTRFHFTHDDAYFLEDGKKVPFIDPEELEREKWNCGGIESPKYQREFLCVFTDAEGAFFSLDNINNTLKLDLPQIPFALPNHRYVIGADLAIENDYTVIVILDCTDKKNLRVVRYLRFNGKSPSEIIFELHRESQAFKPIKVLIDNAGIGVTLIDYFKSNYPGIKCEGFNFTTTSKVPLMSELKIAMDNRILEIPDDDRIREELVSFCYEENANTKHLKLAGKGAHDDIPIALALAVRASGVFGNSNAPLLIGSDKGILKRDKHPPLAGGHVFL
ncbi:MAG: terminase family protein [Bacteroidota bacterium]|nr:terminase family protein [Bacteroidota bacterium]